MPFNRPLEQYFYGPKSAKVNSVNKEIFTLLRFIQDGNSWGGFSRVLLSLSCFYIDSYDLIAGKILSDLTCD